jgi:hypothetical protein
LIFLAVSIANSIVKNEFGYFADGCFTDRPSLVHFPATGDRQFKKQYRIQRLRMVLLMWLLMF